MEYIVDTVKKENYEISYIKFGNGSKNFVVIPGMSFRPLSFMPESFVDAYERFGEEYTVYLFDRKNNMEDGYLVEDMADDTLDAIKTLGLKDLYLFGASQGGMIAQLIAINYPKLVKKLVLASTSYYSNFDASDIFSEMSKLCDEKNVRGLVSYCVRKMYSNEFVNQYKDSIIDFYKDLNDDELHQYKIMCNAFRKIFTLNDLDKISAKTLVIVSKEDLIFGYENSLQMVLKLNCECVLYEDYSHCVYDEADDYKERLIEFFNSK